MHRINAPHVCTAVARTSASPPPGNNSKSSVINPSLLSLLLAAAVAQSRPSASTTCPFLLPRAASLLLPVPVPVPVPVPLGAHISPVVCLTSPLVPAFLFHRCVSHPFREISGPSDYRSLPPRFSTAITDNRSPLRSPPKILELSVQARTRAELPAPPESTFPPLSNIADPKRVEGTKAPCRVEGPAGKSFARKARPVREPLAVAEIASTTIDSAIPKSIQLNRRD